MLFYELQKCKLSSPDYSVFSISTGLIDSGYVAHTDANPIVVSVSSVTGRAYNTSCNAKLSGATVCMLK